MYKLFVQDSMFYQQVIFDSQVEQLSTINFFTSGSQISHSAKRNPIFLQWICQ